LLGDLPEQSKAGIFIVVVARYGTSVSRSRRPAGIWHAFRGTRS